MLHDLGSISFSFSCEIERIHKYKRKLQCCSSCWLAGWIVNWMSCWRAGRQCEVKVKEGRSAHRKFEEGKLTKQSANHYGTTQARLQHYRVGMGPCNKHKGPAMQPWNEHNQTNTQIINHVVTQSLQTASVVILLFCLHCLFGHGVDHSCHGYLCVLVYFTMWHVWFVACVPASK